MIGGEIRKAERQVTLIASQLAEHIPLLCGKAVDQFRGLAYLEAHLQLLLKFTNGDIALISFYLFASQYIYI